MELVLDCHSGISGDRFLAALIGLGADARRLHALPSRLGLEDAKLTTELETIGSSDSRRATVRVDYGRVEPMAFPELSAALNRAWLPDVVREAAEASIYKLCKAEARRSDFLVSDHKLSPEMAADALLTITGGIVLWAAINCPRITTSGPVVVGGAALHSTRELLATVPHTDGPSGLELTTPAAAALLGFFWREPSPRQALLVGEVTVPYGLSEDAVRGELHAVLQEDTDGDINGDESERDEDGIDHRLI